MRQSVNHQRLLPFAAETSRRTQLPQETQNLSRALLARLLAKVVTAETEERKADEHRENPADPS